MPKPCPICKSTPIEVNIADIDEDEDDNWVVGCVNGPCSFSYMYFSRRDWKRIDRKEAERIIREANA